MSKQSIPSQAVAQHQSVKDVLAAIQDIKENKIPKWREDLLAKSGTVDCPPGMLNVPISVKMLNPINGRLQSKDYVFRAPTSETAILLTETETLISDSYLALTNPSYAPQPDLGPKLVKASLKTKAEFIRELADIYMDLQQVMLEVNLGAIGQTLNSLTSSEEELKKLNEQKKKANTTDIPMAISTLKNTQPLLRGALFTQTETIRSQLNIALILFSEHNLDFESHISSFYCNFLLNLGRVGGHLETNTRDQLINDQKAHIVKLMNCAENAEQRLMLKGSFAQMAHFLGINDKAITAYKDLIAAYKNVPTNERTPLKKLGENHLETLVQLLGTNYWFGKGIYDDVQTNKAPNNDLYNAIPMMESAIDLTKMANEFAKLLGNQAYTQILNKCATISNDLKDAKDLQKQRQAQQDAELLKDVATTPKKKQTQLAPKAQQKSAAPKTEGNKKFVAPRTNTAPFAVSVDATGSINLVTSKTQLPEPTRTHKASIQQNVKPAQAPKPLEAEKPIQAPQPEKLNKNARKKAAAEKKKLASVEDGITTTLTSSETNNEPQKDSVKPIEMIPSTANVEIVVAPKEQPSPATTEPTPTPEAPQSSLNPNALEFVPPEPALEVENPEASEFISRQEPIPEAVHRYAQSQYINPPVMYVPVWPVVVQYIPYVPIPLLPTAWQEKVRNQGQPQVTVEEIRTPSSGEARSTDTTSNNSPSHAQKVAKETQTQQRERSKTY
ncbi:MAG: hypothetical protein K0R63_253 [Rickettsiales bacterium]|jgi:hypothetical protein|nr:hypothetical protein [Rickettsiales bacterium]